MSIPVLPASENLPAVLSICEQPLADGNLDGAMRELNEAVRQATKNAELLSHRGRLALIRGDTDSAGQDFSDALKLNPQCAAACSGLARQQFEAGNVIEAEFNAYRALGLDAGNGDAAAILRSLKQKPNRSGKESASERGNALFQTPGPKQMATQTPLQMNYSDVLGINADAEKAREALQQFTEAGQEFFAGVEPPELTELNLKNSRVLPSRKEILPFMPKGGIYAEVGTQTGGFAKLILSILNPAKLHLFDMDFTPFDHVHFEAAIQRGQVKLHSGDSSALMAAMPERHFDFIYIDGDHSYEGVTRDLQQAARKIKADGWIVCNDYTPYSPLEKIKYGVYRAVNEFCLQRGFEIIYLALHPWGYHDVALKQHQHLGGAFLDAPDPNTFVPDVWEYLTSKYGVRRVLDVGAGVGWSTKWFLDRGIEAVGIEGWHEALEKSQCRSLMVEHDFTNGPYQPERAFDLCWCSEFVEHIEEHHIPNFMTSFQACRYVCMTHGEIGQIGYHHVNCQTTDYWIKKMKEFGFEVDLEETAYLRSTDTEKRPWGRKTLTFFRNIMSADNDMKIIQNDRQVLSMAIPQMADATGTALVDCPQIVAGEEATQGTAVGIIQKIGPGDEMFTGDRAHYFGVGRSALRGVENALMAAGIPHDSIRNILDLPCGHGRVMRYFKAAFPQAQITACDLNQDAVDFCAKTFAAQPVNSHTDVNQIPLYGKFDLIWSGSLLTHLRAEACRDFVRLFSNLINPGGMIVFTLHGRWVERSLATNRYTYGLEAADVTALLKEYYESGFGYANYPGVAGYGISVCSPAYVLSQLVSLPDLKLVSYHEKGWDNHQDIICLQKQPLDELLGESRPDV